MRPSFLLIPVGFSERVPNSGFPSPFLSGLSGRPSCLMDKVCLGPQGGVEMARITFEACCPGSHSMDREIFNDIHPFYIFYFQRHGSFQLLMTVFDLAGAWL